MTLILCIISILSEASGMPSFGKLTPSAITSSSVQSPWQPDNVLLQDDNIWHSGINTGNQEWIQLEFAELVLPTDIFCEFANGRDGTNTVVQGNVDGETDWETLLTLDSSKYSVNADNYAEYEDKVLATWGFKYIRVISDAVPYLNYRFIQLFGAGNSASGELTPFTVTSSSITRPWADTNTLNPAKRTYWMSLVNQNQAEWVRYEFENSVEVTNYLCVFGNQHGTNPRVEGSNDGTTNWTTLLTYSRDKYRHNAADNFNVFEEKVEKPQSYKYIRVMSDATVYVLYNFITFFTGGNTDPCANKVCEDNNMCTSDGCDSETGDCIFTDNFICNDNNNCTNDGCDPQTGLCTFINKECNDNELCTTDECDALTGECKYTEKECTEFGDVCQQDTGNCGRDCTKFAIDAYLEDCSSLFSNAVGEIEDIKTKNIEQGNELLKNKTDHLLQQINSLTGAGGVLEKINEEITANKKEIENFGMYAKQRNLLGDGVDNNKSCNSNGFYGFYSKYTGEIAMFALVLNILLLIVLVVLIYKMNINMVTNKTIYYEKINTPNHSSDEEGKFIKNNV
eukprot:472862_1